VAVLVQQKLVQQWCHSCQTTPMPPALALALALRKGVTARTMIGDGQKC
jgi:hypothetical protein